MMLSLLKNAYHYFRKEKLLVPKEISLLGKTVILTGASGGIGEVLTEALVKSGANVVLVARNLRKLKQKYALLKNILFLEKDISKEINTKFVVQRTLAEFMSIDVLINAAGGFVEKPIENFTEEDFSQIYETNLKTTFFMTKSVIPKMKHQKNGLIINLGSFINRSNVKRINRLGYATTKFALEGFSSFLREELLKFGVRVCFLMPGTVKTFLSQRTENTLKASELVQVVLLIISFDKVNFDSVVFRAVHQET